MSTSFQIAPKMSLALQSETVNGIFYNRFKTVSLRFFYLIRVMPELNIETGMMEIKKEARGLDGSDLGEEALQEVSV